MAEQQGDRRQPRADSARNRAHILTVAEQVFAEDGIAASLNEIAKRAGVGPGTLYRHFPNRDSLLAALLEDRDRQLAARRAEIESAKGDSSTALQQWLDAVGQWASAFNGLPEPLREALAEQTSPLTLTCQGFVTDTEMFLRRAQRDGSARAEIAGRELFLTVLASSWVSGAALANDSSSQAIRFIMRSGWAEPTER